MQSASQKLPAVTLSLYIQRRHLERLKAGILKLHWLVRDINSNGKEDIAEDTDEYILERNNVDGAIETADFHMVRNREADNSITRPVSCIAITDTHSLIPVRQQDGYYIRLGLICFALETVHSDDGLYSPEALAS